MVEMAGIAHLPINQEARRFLQLAKVNPDPDIPAVFELMLWGLDHGLRTKDPYRTSLLRGAVETLAYLTKPTVAMAYLTVHPDDPDAEPMDERDLQRAMSPRRAALRLLHVLDERLCVDEDMDGVYPPGLPPRDLRQ